MTPKGLLRAVVWPTLHDMGPAYAAPQAAALLVAIALQETGLKHRVQIGAGGSPLPSLARGWWQFERGGGVRGVLTHPASREMAAEMCERQGVPPQEVAVHQAIADDDRLACAFARLLLWTHPRPLPAVGDVEESWRQYLTLWRPGKPHRQRWGGCIAEASHALAALAERRSVTGAGAEGDALNDVTEITGRAVLSKKSS